MRTMLNTLAIAAIAVAPSLASAQAMNPRGEAKVALAGKTVAIDYGRPSLKGRDMLGLAAVGQPWRMGADSATKLKTEADLAFGDVTVAKGDYVLTAKKVDADTWHLLFNQNDAVKHEVPLAGSKLDASVEMFTIELRGEKNAGEFEMKWGTAAFKAPFSVK